MEQVLANGGFTPLLYAFDDREKILDLLEAITGSRLTYSYYRIGGLYNDVDDNFIKGTRDFVKQMRPRLKMYRSLVTDNIILRKRLIDIGPLSAKMCRKYGATGPVIRGAGVPYDVRKAAPYLVYDRLDFDIPVRSEGDALARYLIRIDEIKQSIRIIDQCLHQMPDGPIMGGAPRFAIFGAITDHTAHHRGALEAFESARERLDQIAIPASA